MNKKDKNQNIQVFVRVRPTNNAERTGKSATVVDATSCEEVVVRERSQDESTKKFTFDRVFGPESKQVDVYNAVVSPLLDEILEGYNCTVFAYGQTDTGKTFTMEGAGNDPMLHWQSNTQAGIIPRSLSHLFDELRTLDAQEYTVRVSFLELYNEELFDLLSPMDDASKIRLYEDASRKGAVIVHGLEEVTVHNKSEVYKILEKGSEKRQTAATLMNAQSSRSHTVFTITVHIKENTVDGEELLKTGKLNLVDLAGSENVGRSGVVDRRAREAGSINQSLLTLGRVITALVERAPHIPYRDSKLTRLLQESLGGRTKTSIIATVSPASINLEETLSTLDYAHRAKNITNRPEINKKLSKKASSKEVERSRRDLLATRERNGVYLTDESYNEMQSTIECQRKDIEEKINHIKALEETMFNKEKMYTDLQVELEQRTIDLSETKDQLESTKNVLQSTKNLLKTTKLDRDVHKHLVEKHATTEKILYSQAQTLLKVADTATDDNYKLHDKIFRKKRVEDENENLGQQFRGNIAKNFGEMEQDLSILSRNLVKFCLSMKNQLLNQTAVISKGIDVTIQLSKDLVKEERAEAEILEQNVNASYDVYKKWIEAQVSGASDMTEEQIRIQLETSAKLAPRIHELCENKIAENLRLVNEQTAKKFENMLTYIKDSTATFFETLLADHEKLLKRIVEMQDIIDTATDDNYKLHDKIFRKKRVEDENENLGQQFRGNIAKNFGEMEQDLSILSRNLVKFCLSMKNQLLNQTAVISKGIDVTIQLSKDLVKEERAEAEILEQNVNASYDVYKKWIEAQVSGASDMTEEQIRIQLETSAKLAPRIHELCENKIAENLRLVNEQTAKKFENMLTYIKDSTATFFETLLADHEKLLKRIVEMQDIIDTSKRTQDESAKRRNDFSQNRTIADESIEKSKVLVNEFQTGIIENCESLNADKNLVQRNAESTQEITDTDRASFILSADRLRKIVSDASVNRVEIVEQQRHKVADGLTETGRKFENQAVESTEWNNRITAQLRTNQHQGNEFLVEDIRRDVPTGMTSPHERIIKRSRQTRKESEGSEDEQDLQQEPTTSQTSIVDTTVPEPPNNGTRRRSPRLLEKERINYRELGRWRRPRRLVKRIDEPKEV